jgi:hypothetical protein
MVYTCFHLKKKGLRMNDIERLQQWMDENRLNTRMMAEQMGMPFQTAYQAITVRGKKAGKDTVTGNFVVRFIATYGYETASTIFTECMKHSLVSSTVVS